MRKKAQYTTSRPGMSVVLLVVIAMTLAACGGDTSTSTEPEETTTSAQAGEITTTSAQAEESTTTAQAELEPLTIQFTWLPSPGFAPVFLAQERGYFEEEGLDVTISVGGGAVGAPTQLATGAADIAVGGVDDVPNANSEGIPLVSLAVIERYSPCSIIVRADSDVTEPADLEGQTITSKSFDVCGALLPAYLQAVGVDPASVTVNQVDPQAQIPLFVSGETDLGSGFTRDEAVEIELSGVDVRLFPYIDAGVFFPSTGIFTTTDILEEKPDLMRGAVRAILRGYADAVREPEASIAAAAALYPEQYENMEANIGDAELYAENIRTHVPEEGLGFQRAEDWQTAVDLLVQYMGLENPKPAEEYFTNDFLPEEGISLD